MISERELFLYLNDNKEIVKCIKIGLNSNSLIQITLKRIIFNIELQYLCFHDIKY